MVDVMTTSLTNSLASLGLTQYESIAYLSLMNEGVCSAREISGTCGMPYGKTYEVIRNLEKKGFVNILPTKPLQCTAVEPENAFRRVRETFLSKVKKIESHVKRIVHRKKAHSRDKPVFLMMKGRSLINTRIEMMISGAKKDIFIMTTQNGTERFKYFNAALNNCDAKVHLMRNPNGRNSLISVDGKECLFFESVPDDCELASGSDKGIFISDKSSTQFLDMLLMSCIRLNELNKGAQ